MHTVAQILKAKQTRAVHSISPGALVMDAIRLLAEKGIGALLVTQDEQIVGIFTERDYVRKVEVLGRSPETTWVKDIMSAPVMYVSLDQSNEECMALMTENRLRHLPVLDKGELVGIISIGDLVKDIISEQQFIIDQLERYIQGAKG
ncbi:CBS domain-containing protein [Candidimonas sp. SYP-B2681]|uniref:CBS domain-containing protein n=1 Tax=Candidimonas sp. SYP-B2681 TaxID=2497686 RepID=UPI000F88EA66|nr:CBS domain-containing protein [Candidimonas sp. SYP-B2681]RTZ41722.1 CBS domain-containing protein [Candidimonas sp. SYP-B2681]